MAKRNLSQTFKRPRQFVKENPVEKSSTWERVRDVIVTLGAASGILAGVLWMGGRFYAYGYFDRMNIPLYFLSFSAGEYAETYITSITGNILVFFIHYAKFIPVILVAGLIFGIVIWAIQKRYKKLKIREAVDKVYNLNNRLLVMLSLVLFLLSFAAAYDGGNTAAYYMLTNSYPVTVYSKDLLSLGTPSVVSSSDNKSSLYEFTGLYLLTYNSGKYYFFKELDLTTCKPKDVYIASDNDLIGINITNAPSGTFKCTNP